MTIEEEWERELVKRRRKQTDAMRLERNLVEVMNGLEGYDRQSVRWVYEAEMRSVLEAAGLTGSEEKSGVLLATVKTALSDMAKPLLSWRSLRRKPGPYADSKHDGYLRSCAGSLHDKLKKRGLQECVLFLTPHTVILIDMVARKLKLRCRSTVIEMAMRAHLRFSEKT